MGLKKQRKWMNEETGWYLNWLVAGGLDIIMY